MNIATNVLELFSADFSKLKVDLENKLDEDYKFGEYYPMVWVNDMFLTQEIIISIEISLKGFLPRISLTISDNYDQFVSLTMPKKQDLVSILIKDRKADFKPIKANFTIDSISSFNGSIGLSGDLFIPKFDKQICISYDNLTSHEVLESIASELGLGFATNEDITSDIQNWIIPFKKYSEFLSKISDYIYKDEEMNYYEIFIDIYYNLNLVNVPKLFQDGLEDEQTQTYINTNDYLNWESRMDEEDYQREEETNEPLPLFLTNMQDYIGNNNYFERYNFLNNTGSTYKSIGVNKVQRFYDLDDKIYFNHDLVLDFERDEELNELIVQDEEMDMYKWSGVINDNHHLNYEWVKFKSAALRSFYNRNVLTLTLNRANFYLHRYLKIPVQIWTLNSFDNDYLNELEEIQGNSNELQEQQDVGGENYSTGEKDPILNKFTSGYYTLKDYIYVWKQGDIQFSQECSFIKPLYVNVVNKSDNSNG